MEKFHVSQAEDYEGMVDLLLALAGENEDEDDDTASGLSRMETYALIETRFGNWWDKAECRGSDADLFFPERGSATAKALGMCAVCKTREACLITALETNEVFGIWGGAAERTRRVFKKILIAGGDWDDVIDAQQQVLKENKKFKANVTTAAARGKLEEVEARDKKPAA